MINPTVDAFYDPATSTFTYVAQDANGMAAIIDPVLDFDMASARTSTTGADKVLDFVKGQDLKIEWILETHAHADHLSAAKYLQGKTGAPIAIGQGITQVQERFTQLFRMDDATDGSQFDHLFKDGDTFNIGELQARVIATPGHTDDSITYVIGDAAFIGDTLFAPDVGTARTDFPGGDAGKLYQSIQKLLNLPNDTRLFLCHDYPPEGRGEIACVSIDEQRERNKHVGGDVTQEAYVQMREARDATLPVPKLILPSLQVNIRAGELPDDFFRLPVNQL